MERPSYLDRQYDLQDPAMVSAFDELPLWSARFGWDLLSRVRYRKGIHALDIGFGTGFPVLELAMRLGPSSRVTGIDPWSAAIQRARQKKAFYGIKHLELLQGTAEELPLPDQSVDLITSNNGLNNVHDLDLALQECRRVLKPGGQFLHSMNLDSSMHEFYTILEQVLQDEKQSEALENMKTHIYKKRKPKEEMLQLLEQHGLAVESVHEDAFAYYFADGTAFFQHYFIQLAFLEDWKALIPQQDQGRIFSVLEQRINQLAAAQGQFQLSIPYIVIDCRRLTSARR
ncbi:MAG: class I SAM-dependent methyltransferase [Phaeodactylibacter sp.]|nr:class I SAM-dependent methyltransferase [Phaeodactylibacter sp.]